MLSGKFISKNQGVNPNVTDKNLNDFLSEHSKVFITDSEITGALIDTNRLTENTRLRKLRLTNCRIDQTTIDPLAQALALNTTLTHLDLSGNDLGNEGVETLLNCILNNPNSVLRTLNLSDNKIDSLNPLTIKRLLQSQTLQTLILDGNALRTNNTNFNQTLRHIFESLGNNTSLTYLSLKQATIDSYYDSPLLQRLTASLNQNTSLARLGLLERDFVVFSEKDKKNALDHIEASLKNLKRSNSQSQLFHSGTKKEASKSAAPPVTRYNR